MPNSVVRSLAKKTGKSVTQVEKAWKLAKAIVLQDGVKQDDPLFYHRVTHATKNIIKKEKIDMEEMHLRYGDISNPKKLDIHNPEKFKKNQAKRDAERGIKRRKPFEPTPIKVEIKEIKPNSNFPSLISSILSDLDL